MVNRVSTSGRDRTAIATSIVLHGCALIALAALPRTTFPVDTPDERALLASMIRIERRPPAPQVVRPRRAAAPVVVAASTTREPPVVHVAHTVSHAKRALVVTAERRFSPRALHVAVQPRSSTAPTLVAVDRTAAKSTATAGPNAAAAPSPAPSAAALAQREDGIGNFGEDYPAKVDPASRSTLFTGLAGSFLIRIALDEDGHPTAIEFVRAPSDPSLQQELRSRLLAARFIPQICNGLRCPGTLELRN